MANLCRIQSAPACVEYMTCADAYECTLNFLQHSHKLLADVWQKSAECYRDTLSLSRTILDTRKLPLLALERYVRRRCLCVLGGSPIYDVRKEGGKGVKNKPKVLGKRHTIC